MSGYDDDGVYAEIERLSAVAQRRAPLYSDRYLSRRTPGTEHLGAAREDDVQLTHDDLVAAQRELAELHGVTSARVRGMVMLTHVQAGLGYTEQEQAQVLREVALSLERGQSAVSDDQVLELSGLAVTGDGHGEREAVRDEAMTLGLAVTDVERARLVETGEALGPDGDFPVHDARHLAAAKAGYRKRHLAGHSAAEVRAHVNRGAKRLGLPGLDEDDHDDHADDGEDDVTAGLSQESAALELARSGGDSAAAVIARHPEFAHLFERKAGRTAGGRHPARSGRLVTTRTRAHSTDEDPVDHQQPAKGGKVHPEVERLLQLHASMFGSSTVYPVKSPAQREAGEARARAGHQGSTPVPDLARHVRRGSNTTYPPLPRGGGTA